MKIIAMTALALATSTAASAAEITYTLSGTGAGLYVDFADPSQTIQSFAPDAISFVGHGQTPGVYSGGVERVPLVAGEVTGLFSGAVIPVGMDSVFAVSGGLNQALFGDYDGVSYAPSVYFEGLGSYDGVSALGATPVTNVTFQPFPISAGGHEYGVEFTSFTDAVFSASVPEPTTWALMLIGLGLAGAGVRSRRKPLFS